jgi:hypothetical protein
MRYVTIKKLAELTGYSVEAIEGKIRRRDFVEGVHYVKAPGGRIHIDTEAYEKWVTSDVQVLSRGAPRSGSRSNTKGSGVMKL